MNTLEMAFLSIEKAKKPQDIFGTLANTTPSERAQALRKAFHSLVQLVHPDHNGNSERAKQAFLRLMELHAQAERVIDPHSSAVQSPAPTQNNNIIKTPKATYVVQDLLGVGDFCNVHRAIRAGDSQEFVIKSTLQAGDNDLLANEHKVLKALWSHTGDQADHFCKYLPMVVEAATLADARRMHVLTYEPDFFPLTDVLKAFPKGLDPRDAAWMGNRALEILAWIHEHKVVHGAVLPCHILIRPCNHTAKLIGWCASIKEYGTSHITAMSSDWTDYYPPEVMQRQAATPALDVFMIAQCITALIGGDTSKRGAFPRATPKRISGFLDACRLARPAARFEDGRTAYLEFRSVLKELYGPPAFRSFTMPKHSAY